ncbi:Collagen alpha-1(XII) chain [Toxocara canis]|uniref:Collagen alpha-1(XII) chain n=1 Tax=Toxocara canis TaxID=6265 RepID=A0A0B2VRE9_TOXCA|nr:Collagen alpha-1(XII) chain [Toxocara canis]
MSKTALQEVINQLPYVQGSTDTGSAIGVVLDEFVSSRRNGVPLVIFTISDGYHRRGLTSLTNGNTSNIALGGDVVERSKQLLSPFVNCRIQRSEVRRKPESKILPTTLRGINSEINRISNCAKERQRDVLASAVRSGHLMWLARLTSLFVLLTFVESCADFIFIIDGSASVQQQFKRIIAIARNVASELKIGSGGHRAAILEYSSVARLRKWPRYFFEHISSKTALQEVINQLPYVQGSTDTGSAIGVVLDEFVSSRRNGVPLVIFTISDGYHRDEEIVRRNMARLASLSNVHLFAATASPFYSIRGLTSLTNGNTSNIALGGDVVERSKQLLSPFVNCRIQRSEVRRKPESKILPTTLLTTRKATTTTATTSTATTATTTTRTTTIYTTTTRPYTGKPGCQLDVVLLMDFSGGAVDKRDAYIELASSLIKNLHLGPFDVQVAMIRYSGPGRADTVFHLNKHTNANDAVLEMAKAPHMGGTTRTGEAIKFAMSEFDEKNGGRKNAKKIIVLFTDGYSQEDPAEAAQLARRSGIEMNAVAVEDELVPPDTDQLVAIATESGVYMASAFDKLRSRISDRLRQCK